MYGLQARFDPAMFIGLELEHVTYASNALHMSFSNGIALTSKTWVQYRVHSGVAFARDDLPVAASSLMGLVGAHVAESLRTVGGGLALTFSNGGRLEVEDDSPHYECYAVTTPDGEIFV